MQQNEEQNQAEELENYLSSSYLNRVIYHRLIKGDRSGLFEPLEFIKQLRGLYSYLTLNKHKPSVLVEKLDKIVLTDEQKSFLLHYLDILFFEDSIRNAIERQLHPESSTEDTLGVLYQVEILAGWAKLNPPVDDLAGYEVSDLTLVRDEYVHRRPGGKEDLAREVMGMGVNHRLRLAIRDRYNFNRVRQHLDTLPDNTTRIAYLIEIETEYLQVGASSDYKSKRFDQKCEMERAKLGRLIEVVKLEKPIPLAQTVQAAEEKPVATQGGWTKEAYLILAVSAAKTIGQRGDKLTDEAMAEELGFDRRTALRYRHENREVYDATVRREHEEGLKEYTARRRKT